MLPLLRTSTSCRLIKQLSNIKQSDFRTVYKFPYVRGVGLINRLKLYQTALTSVTVPGVTVLNQLGVTSSDSVLFTGIIGLLGIIPLYILGYFSNRLVGIVYLNEKENLVKLAYLDFWGKRKELVVPANDIVPFSEAPASFIDPLYLTVRQFTSKYTLKLCSKYGIVDVKGFNKVFII
jgi:hypothetical protein